MKKTIIVIGIILLVLALAGLIGGIVYYEHNKNNSNSNNNNNNRNSNNNKLQWQSNCQGDGCSGLIWMDTSNEPWNRYYQISCINPSGIESTKSSTYGPVNNYNWAHPKIRMQADGVNPCGSNIVKIYSGSSNSNLTQLKPNGFDAKTPYDGTDAIFTDN